MSDHKVLYYKDVKTFRPWRAFEVMPQGFTKKLGNFKTLEALLRKYPDAQPRKI